jgi:hypothetical protein
MIEAIRTIFDFNTWVGFFVGAAGMFFLKDMFVDFIDRVIRKNR